ncbi:fumarylacetoacetate hydrolase family protein [Burkholderiaceae bacterium FT117]|uniref:2-keto-4-pentenoate hydratase n=1 Tax=Zeimonas sediminis TaxID=2944268 RepID=UPI00234316B7|nr:fumarylacetoacetate hydrolase family protein [Zeimonas sediminis]MCM5571960.1 fumarylacetoacetate hydrolase family protein [Zeimonas sediminis]
MIDDDAAKQAAGLLWKAWRTAGTLAALPEACRPDSRADGYRIQSELLALAGRGWGWKIAATSVAGQQHIGVDGPLGGRIFADRIHAPGDTVSLAGNRMRVAEVEFAFRIGRTLEPRDAPWRSGELLEAVDALLPSIEIPDSRFEPFERAGAPQLIADNACAWRFVPGKPAPESWRDADLAAWQVRAAVGGRYTRDGIGSNVLGDPRLALAWLVDELSAQGIPLEAGQVVTTGTCLPPLEIQPGDHLVADFGALGTVDVRFAE